MAEDLLSAALKEIRDRGERVWKGRGNVGGLLAVTEAKDDVPRLLAAVGAVLKAHPALPLYVAASDCDHPEPPEDASEWADWDGDHQPGTGDVGRICELTPTGSHYCPGCTHIVYGDDEPNSDDYVAAPCSVREAITRALTGEVS